MNSYNLSRIFFDFCFENPEKIKPNHIAVYFFAIEHCNRLGWQKKFGFPTEMAKSAIGIRSYNTYIKTLNDLVEWGFIEMIERSKNQFSSNIIALSYFDKALDKALDKAIVKHVTKQSESTGESICSINKPLTNKPINLITLYVEKDFLNDWNELRSKFLKKPSNLNNLSQLEKSKFEILKLSNNRDNFTNAMTALFKQEVIKFSSMTLRPLHFLEKFDMYLSAFTEKDSKLYGSKKKIERL